MKCFSQTQRTQAVHWPSLLFPHPPRPSRICWLDFTPSSASQNQFSLHSPPLHLSKNTLVEKSVRSVTSYVKAQLPCATLDHTHPKILPSEDFPAIFSALICLPCLWSHFPVWRAGSSSAGGLQSPWLSILPQTLHVNSSTITRFNHHLCISDSSYVIYCTAAVPNLFHTRDQFQGRQLFHRCGGGRGGLGIIQAHYIYCALYFYYYYIKSTPGHQVLDPGGWGRQIGLWREARLG